MTVGDEGSDQEDLEQEAADDEELSLRRIRPTGDGGARLTLGPIERLLLGELVDRLARRLDGDDPSTARLFPPAHPHDAEAEAEYRSLTHDSLLDGRRSAIASVRSTLDATSLGAPQVGAWLGVVNDLRLVVGTELGVTAETADDPPDEDDPDYRHWVEYLYLTWLESQLIDAAADSLA